jgi:hypothetical protein
MFCRLCTAEFRDGFTECSDCRVALVATREEAEARRVRVWKGSRQEKLDRFLGALDDGQVPFHMRELANTHVHFSLFGIPIGKRKPMLEYEVWIFRLDLERAHKAVAKVLRAKGAAR